jgi:nucleotide-binding universal stress UspA family protein
LLVGYDGSASADLAARWALDEAARTGGAVEFSYVFEWPAWAPVASLVPGTSVWPDGTTEQRIRGMLADVQDGATGSHPGVPVSVTVAHGNAALSLCERSRGADLIVLGSHGHSEWADLLLGSVSLSVSAHAHCPVIVIRRPPVADGPETVERARTEPSGTRIVAGLDGSAGAELALGFAFEQASGRGVPLRVIRVWTPPFRHRSEAEADIAGVLADELAAVEDVLAGWRGKYPTVQVSTDVVVGHPGRTLVEASASAQLVVVGSRGRGGFRGLLLGSVSQQLLHHGRCAIAVVRERSAVVPGGPAAGGRGGS